MPKTHTPRQGETAKQCQERIVRRRKLNAFLFLAGLVGLIIVLSYTVFFPMTDFEVAGSTRYAKTVLEAASGVKPRTQLLNLSTERARENLLDELPYLENVSVRRRLPRTLIVTVEDAKTVFAINEKDGFVVISGKGKVLELTKNLPKDALPFTLDEIFEAPVGGKIIFSEDKEKNDWVWQIFEAFIFAYENCDYTSEITALGMENPYFPTMTYQNRITLGLGSRDSFTRQLNFARRTINELDKEDKEKKRKPSRGTLKLDVDGQSFFTHE